MTWNEKLYRILVNRIPGIQSRYQHYRKRNNGRKRAKAWFYLLSLNFAYYFLRKKDLSEDEDSFSDLGRKIAVRAESLLTDRESPESLAEKLSVCDVVSFDVFDTLILRKVNEPEAVFYILQEQTGYMNLKRLRCQAEHQARLERRKKVGDTEVNLEEIWRIVEKKTGIPAKKGMELEQRTEESVCCANPYFYQVISLLSKRKEPKLVVCSDMYLGAERIQRLLKKCGYPEFAGYYCSCDYRCSKSTGELYEKIRRDYGREKEYIHIGDNPVSDVEGASKHGFTALYYPSVGDLGNEYRARDMSPLMSSVYSGIVNNYLYNGTNKESQAFEFGFIYGGLFVTGYCQFIHEYVNSCHIDKILFLSRDGDILNRAYQLLYPEDAAVCEYVYWSRLASVKLCAGIYKDYYMERMIRHKTGQGYRLESIFRTMDLEDMFEEYLADSCLSLTRDSVLDQKIVAELEEFLDKNWDKVCGHYKEEYLEAKNYYAEKLAGAKKAVAVDVGWVGSGAATLKALIEKEWKLPCKLYGLVAGTCGRANSDFEATEIEFASRQLSAYLFSAFENRDIWKKHDAVKGHNMLAELLLSSPNPSFRGFKKDKAGGYCFNTDREKVDAIEIQRGILTFAKLFKAHPLGHLEISGRDAAAPILLLYENEDYVRRLIRTSEIKPNIE